MPFFFFILKHLRAPKRSWKVFHGVLESPGEVLDFFVSKRVGTLVIHFLLLWRDIAYLCWKLRKTPTD